MKNFGRFFLGLIMSMVVFTGNAQSNSLRRYTNAIPDELGKYLRLSNSPITYEISEVDEDGNVVVSITMEFEVIKHDAKIGYFELKGDLLSRTNHSLLKFDCDYTAKPQFKVNHNPHVGQELADAIKNPKTNTVTVTFDKVCEEAGVQRLSKEAKSINFTMSRFNE